MLCCVCLCSVLCCGVLCVVCFVVMFPFVCVCLCACVCVGLLAYLLNLSVGCLIACDVSRSLVISLWSSCVILRCRMISCEFSHDLL